MSRLGLNLARATAAKARERVGGNSLAFIKLLILKNLRNGL